MALDLELERTGIDRLQESAAWWGDHAAHLRARGDQKAAERAERKARERQESVDRRLDWLEKLEDDLQRERDHREDEEQRRAALRGVL